MTVVSREDITKQTPEKSLVEPRQKTGGRNNTGRVTSSGSVILRSFSQSIKNWM